MKNTGLSIFAFALIFTAFTACGESEAERQAREQARQDSLRQAREAEAAQYEALLQQARQDSIEQAEAAAAALAEQEGTTPTTYDDISFSDDGTYAIQVGVWRSEEKANSFVTKWSERGYENAYVIKIGDEDTGDVWFRVRIGFLDTKEEADNLGTRLNEEFGTPFWTSKVQRGN